MDLRDSPEDRPDRKQQAEQQQREQQQRLWSPLANPFLHLQLVPCTTHEMQDKGDRETSNERRYRSAYSPRGEQRKANQLSYLVRSVILPHLGPEKMVQ